MFCETSLRGHKLANRATTRDSPHLKMLHGTERIEIIELHFGTLTNLGITLQNIILQYLGFALTEIRKKIDEVLSQQTH